ncbi:hypothetical protein LLG95_12615 [bacterium]|nr:hypothetical protein [bacterium]
MNRKNLRRHGSSLAITMVLVTLTALAMTWLAQTVVQMQRINKRKADLTRAYYAAEGGVALVQHFGNYPAQFTRNPALFKSYPGTTGATIFPLLNTTLGIGNYVITESELTQMGFPPFLSQDGRDISSVKEITLMPPDPANDPITCFFKIRSIGRTKTGIERTVVSYMEPVKSLKIQLPAGLLSYNIASAFGNARVHWGESWSKSNFDMLNRSQMGYLVPGSVGYDPYARYRSEGTITFPATWSWGLGADLYDGTRTNPGAAPASGKYNAFEQRLPSGTLQWPEFDYETFKDLAMSHGRYYTTDAAGNIYRNGIEDAAHKVDFYTEFTVPDRATSPYDLIFIDTINGQPPAADGSNLATINVSGTGNGTKGVMYIAANMDATGVGSPPSMVAQDRSGTNRSLDKIFHDGVIYTSGTIAMSGNAGVYGSVVTARGFTGGGTPDIYYNAKLADGLLYGNGNVGSKLKVVMTTNY